MTTCRGLMEGEEWGMEGVGGRGMAGGGNGGLVGGRG